MMSTKSKRKAAFKVKSATIDSLGLLKRSETTRQKIAEKMQNQRFFSFELGAKNEDYLEKLEGTI